MIQSMSIKALFLAVLLLVTSACGVAQEGLDQINVIQGTVVTYDISCKKVTCSDTEIVWDPLLTHMHCVWKCAFYEDGFHHVTIEFGYNYETKCYAEPVRIDVSDCAY